MSVLELQPPETTTRPKKRKSGIPTGNAGEYFVMGELLRRGYDAQLADRNTAGYDLLVGRHSDPKLAKVQVKTVRDQPWYLRQSQFEGDRLTQITIYVLLGKEDARAPVRYFIVRNADVAGQISTPANWDSAAFMRLKTIAQFEGRWDILDVPETVERTMTINRRPRHGTVKQRCFDVHLREGANAAVRLGVEQGVKEASVRRWIYEWAVGNERAGVQTCER